MFLYRVAEPNEALIISGLRAHAGPEGDAAGLGFKIVVGKVGIGAGCGDSGSTAAKNRLQPATASSVSRI